MLVQCVICIDDDDNETVHIFSTREKLLAWCDTDDRRHIVYDYMIDNPDRMEKEPQ